MFYISDYITKMDVKTYEVLSLLSRAVARVPQVGPDVPLTESAKHLLHKCLSQFNGQQQVHAQQAVRYIQGFGDGISSHESTPMLSSLLIGYVKERWTWLNASAVAHEEDDTEHVHLRISTNKDGQLVTANQVHHYIHRADSLAHMNFYEFCRCVRLESISKNAKNKNTFETRLGVLRRHTLKDGHPASETHVLVEHTNDERGDGAVELVPRVIGMSIPRPTDPTVWAIFCLAHFKPFSVSQELFFPQEDPLKAYGVYAFSTRSLDVMRNWEAVHKCEDERDAERLRKRAQLAVESKNLTASLSTGPVDDDVDVALPPHTARRSEDDFRVQQAVLELQQSGWFDASIVNDSCLSQFASAYPASDDISRKIKGWKIEIKTQEQTIATSRRNILNPDNPVERQVVVESESGLSCNTELFQATHSASLHSDHVCPDSETFAAERVESTHLTAEAVVTAIGNSFSLNNAQWRAFRIITSHFIDKYVEKKLDTATDTQLTMLMTGPGGTGKTHVVKAVQKVMEHYGCGHLIRFLAPTGSAAALIDGMTIHKGLGLKIKSNKHGKGNREPGASAEDYSVLISIQNRSQLRDEWKYVEYLLIDEVSLLSLQLLAQIDHALRYAKERPDVWFGGVVVIFAGDLYQFPPVGGSALYSPIAAYAGQTDSEVQKRLGRLVWKTVNVVVTLTEQQRMKDDIGYGEAVNRLRVRQCTEDDVELFNSRLMKTSSYPEGVNLADASCTSATAVVTTNELREVLNARKARGVSGDSLVICAAVDKTNDQLSIEMRNELLHLNITSLKASNALPGFTTLAVGMPVILRVRNVSTDLGITNGSQGIVRHIYTALCAHGLTYTTCVLVEFPHSKVQLSGLPKGVFPILPATWTFTTLLNVAGVQHKIRVTRQQVPIQPAFAVTGHSSQGKTLPHVVVNLHEGGFASYVAASRAKTRQGLCITQRVNLAQLNKRLPTDLLHEVSRCEALDHNTLVKYGYRAGRPVTLPDVEGEIHRSPFPPSAHFEYEAVPQARGSKCGLENLPLDKSTSEQPSSKRARLEVHTPQ